MKCHKTKVLFLIKKRGSYAVSYGLINSCKFVANALERFGIESKIVQVHDANCIDKEVHAYKPTHVFLEAVWVPPYKIPQLMKLKHNRDAIWSVRLHSQASFLALEGFGFDWVRQYLAFKKDYPNFGVSTNSSRLVREFQGAFGEKLEYTPNIYLPDRYSSCLDLDAPFIFKEKGAIDIGLFGAIRPYKAHVAQALAALTFANEIGKKLRLHINVSRFENIGADAVYKSLKMIFKDLRHELVEHEWMNHPEFIEVVKQMDIVMQCSLTETFNIVAADAADQDVPIVVSNEVEWASWLFKAKPMWPDSIINRLYLAYYGRHFNLHRLNKIGLQKWNEDAIKEWLIYLDVERYVPLYC